MFKKQDKLKNNKHLNLKKYKLKLKQKLRFQLKLHKRKSKTNNNLLLINSNVKHSPRNLASKNGFKKTTLAISMTLKKYKKYQEKKIMQ